MTRSLADDLRARDDEALVRLFQARPDLTSPHPVDLGSVVARAATRASSYRALSLLNARELSVAVALTVLAPRPAGGVSRSAGQGVSREISAAQARGGPVARARIGLRVGSSAAPGAGLERTLRRPPRRPQRRSRRSARRLPGPAGRDLRGPGASTCEIGALEQALLDSQTLLDGAPHLLRADCRALLERVDASGSGTGSVSNARRELNDPSANHDPSANPVSWLLSWAAC